MPFGQDLPRAAAPTALNKGGDWLARQTILSQARRMELRELEQAEVDPGGGGISGATIRLGLGSTGGRGVHALWRLAIENHTRQPLHTSRAYSTPQTPA